MPVIIFGPQHHAPPNDGGVRSKAYAFLEKLGGNDALPGLHIEPIARAVDSRVRTGRVDNFWRAVLFKVNSPDSEPAYVYLGVWQHDAAIDFAAKAQLKVNPVNGILELLLHDTPVVPQTFAATRETPANPADLDPYLEKYGHTVEGLATELGLDREVAELAMECRTADEVTELAQIAPGWQGVALIDLSAGRSIESIQESLEIHVVDAPGVEVDDDAALAAALQHPASRLEFALIEDNDELRRAIEDGDFAAWRVFLHPEQRKYAERSWKGAFRLSGGAGTGKTVVLLHRARNLAHRNPSARILLTTFNKTLAEALHRDLKILDPTLPIASKLGEPGVLIRHVDSAVSSVLRSGSEGIDGAVETVLGSRPLQIRKITDRNAWRDAIDSDGADLPPELRSPTFFQAEYELVVLPNRVTTIEGYAKVRRSGRGVALDRKARNAVWKVVSAYRLNAGINGTVDFAESAAIAAAALDAGDTRLADHVLVDEGQDLGPAQWQFLRAVVAEGPDDLFIAEDSHQRIYGNRVVLGRYGIRIVGRAQRLRLNYRTTAQNLRYAMSILTGTDFVDLEDEAEDASGYRSARVGPTPQLIDASTEVDELDQAAQFIRDWREQLDQGVGAESIGILVRSVSDGEAVVRELEDRGVPTRFVSDKTVPAGKPVVMTMHRAKGMEFTRVLILGVDESSMPARYALKNLIDADREDFLQREKSLLYVAATRARDELAIIWSGQPSTLLPTTTT